MPATTDRNCKNVGYHELCLFVGILLVFLCGIKFWKNVNLKQRIDWQYEIEYGN